MSRRVEDETLACDELRRKLEAAEKTVSVLKNKVHALMSGAEKSVIERQLQRSQRRNEAIARRRELSELRANELERYSTRLEGEVRERTRAIRTILDHVTFGFLLVDAEGRIQPGATLSCEALLGATDLAGRLLEDVLGLEPRERSEWRLGLAQVFDDVLPESVNVGQLRSRFTRGDRVLRIEARAVRDELGAVHHLLLSITDVSGQEAAEQDARKAHALVDILRRRDAFQRFVWDARDRLDLALHASDPSAVRAAIHTVKGNAACFGVHEVAAIAHEVEEEGVARGAIARDGVVRVETALSAYLRTNREVLGMELESRHAQGAVLSPSQLDRLVAIAAEGPAPLRALLAEVRRRPALELLGPLDRLVERLAGQLGKDVRVDIDGGSVLVDAAYHDVFAVLGHLVRNAVDHGISDTGTIRISVREEPQEWCISVADDGRGIDDDAVASVAVRRALYSPEQIAGMSREERLQLIFVDGLSTAAQTTDISGRGVGMSAVLRAVRDARGKLSVASTPGHGTKVAIVVPKPLAA